MIYVDNILYIEFTEATQAGISKDTIIKAKNEGFGSWKIIKNPSDKRKVLIDYEALKPKYQQLILDTYGNPYEYYGLNLFKQ